MASLPLRLPQDVADKLHDLARRTSKADALAKAIGRYKDEPFEGEAPTRATTLTISDEASATIDIIVTKNNLKSRNQAVILIIERAWEDARNETLR